MPFPHEIAEQKALRDAEAARVLTLRAEGLTWRKVAERMGVSHTYAAELIKPRVQTTPRDYSQHKRRKPRTQAESEAALFAHLVKTEQITVEEAEADIGVEPRVRELMERAAQESGGTLATMIQNALRLRGAVLREFRCVCRKAA